MVYHYGHSLNSQCQRPANLYLSCLRADVSYFLATKEIGDVCTQANTFLVCHMYFFTKTFLEIAVHFCHGSGL